MKELDKNALFEEAKRRYPIGAKFKVVHSPGDIRKVTSHEKHDYTFVKVSDRLHINLISDLIEGEKSNCISASVYFNGKWAEIVEEPKVETKFEKGKWYKWFQRNHDSYHYGKFYIQKGKTFTMRSWICHCKIYEEEGAFDFQYSEQIQEVPLSEIQQYLPADHPDKIKQEVKEEVKPNITWKIGDYVVFTEDWSCNKKGDIDKIKKLGAGVIALYLENEELVGSPLHKECKLKVFPTLQEAQKFSDELLGKSKTGLGVEDLVKGAIYCSLMSDNPQWESLHLYHGNGENMFKYRLYIHSSYKGNDKFDKSDWGKCTSNQYRLATSLEKKWLKTCIKQDKFIEQSELDKYDDEGNLIESKKYPEYVEFGGVIYKVKDWTPHSYCKLIRHTNDSYPTPLEPFKHLVTPSTKEAYETQFKKDEEFKVGDKIICIKNEGFKIDGFNYSECLKIGKLYTVNSKVHEYWNTEELGITIKEEDFNHPISNFRKALSHEIPVENTVTQKPLIFEDCSKLDFEVKWKEPRYIGGVDPISAFSCGIFEQMKKQSPQSRKTPDLIDKTKVKVEIKRTKVKQIKL